MSHQGGTISIRNRCWGFHHIKTILSIFVLGGGEGELNLQNSIYNMGTRFEIGIC